MRIWISWSKGSYICVPLGVLAWSNQSLAWDPLGVLAWSNQSLVCGLRRWASVRGVFICITIVEGQGVSSLRGVLTLHEVILGVYF